MSGQDVARKLFEIHPSIRVLFASGYSAEDARGPESERVLGFIGKPFRPDDLARQVRAALDHPNPKSEIENPRIQEEPETPKDETTK
jgi:DNA-binding NtrC family response regulator